MKKVLTYLIPFLLFASSYLTSFANDGAYYVSGNQLIPVEETDISVKKEILTIKRKNKQQVEVTVSYEFYNPGNTKSIVVGFEASAPRGDTDTSPKKGKHPNISDFSIQMNHVVLPYKVAIVNDSAYYHHGEFVALSPEEVIEATTEYPEYYYVYYFTAKFKKGINHIRHTYVCDLSKSVDYIYRFDYVLTAANRWANKQIDDFTLIVNMGEFQDFYIDDSPFGKDPEWTLKGKGSIIKGIEYTDYTDNREKKSIRTDFHIRKGEVIYKAANFKPQAELKIYAYRPVAYMAQPFDYKERPYLSWVLIEDTGVEYEIETANEVSKRILKNLPFARKGYIFTSPELKEFYLGQSWYTPDPGFKGNVPALTREERDWVKFYSE
ncbi:YARHG domain-containing protein [Dysgonomonas sp. 521]|uniref:YARHG domain-containing protein n=1 Tax=Dysgonomonas sp. 521 TaxID=2302932 RepID=UPI0013D2D178|nr:YARHG domain-containing protein [Dysgonomonas sp. 521]NDV94589.1 YARHG domain-containing protein [Dysgonomonas sp. 521]